MFLGDESKYNWIFLIEYLLEVSDFLTNVLICYIGFALIMGDGFHKLGIFLIVLLGKVMIYLLSFIMYRKKQKMQGNFKNGIRKELMEAIFIKKSIEDTVHTGELATDVWMGVEWIGVYHFEAVPSLISKLIILSAMVFYMFFLNIAVALTFVISILLVCTTDKLFKAFVRAASKRESVTSEEYAKISMEALNGAETLKSLNAVNIFKNKLCKKAKELKRASMKFVYYTTLSQCIKDCVLVTAKIACLVFVLNSHIIYEVDYRVTLINTILVLSFYSKINLLHGSSLKISKAKVFKEKITKYIKESKIYTKRDNISSNNTTTEYTIYTEDLCFEYPEKTTSVLEDINLNIKKESRVALIGDSGSGKSTIIKCLSGFLNGFTGNVCILGMDISLPESLKRVKEHMSVIWQNNHIFNDTVFENVRISKNDASEEEVIEALKKANLYDFISSLPKGIYTIIGNGGQELSGGQKSRIAIARAFLRDSNIILLDEPTSELDRENEIEIMSNLRVLFKGRTVIQTAHRLETIRDFDVIHFLRDGKVIYSGDHKKLMEISEEYREYFKKL